MRRVTAGILLVAAAVAALPTGQRASPSESRAVVTAAHDLRPGTELTARDLALRRMPRRLVPSGAVTASGRAEGRLLAHAAREGTVLTDLSLLGTELTRFTARGEDRAAVAVRPAETAVTELLHPGGHVDVVTNRRGRTEVLAERATVVSVSTDNGGQESEPLVVLGLDRARAARVASARLRDSLTLTLR
ncbi:SAF domain-containing protein [Actinopolyspora mortivallis]|uniref:SAF domain-containing protein n=1 Tax=Actinopolyspora mortivallis TaxID=33906 RepID=UPI00146A2ED4|nr:SAF domain-containing protein [Actinopolyspora mortivallis]